jgi:hypothetical protein
MPWTSALRPLAQHKHVRQLLAELEKAGCWMGRRGRGHIVVRHENGRSVSVPATPSDRRSLENTRAEIRRVTNRKEMT